MFFLPGGDLLFRPLSWDNHPHCSVCKSLGGQEAATLSACYEVSRCEVKTEWRSKSPSPDSISSYNTSVIRSEILGVSLKCHLSKASHWPEGFCGIRSWSWPCNTSTFWRRDSSKCSGKWRWKKQSRGSGGAQGGASGKLQQSWKPRGKGCKPIILTFSSFLRLKKMLKKLR